MIASLINILLQSATVIMAIFNEVMRLIKVEISLSRTTDTSARSVLNLPEYNSKLAGDPRGPPWR